MTKYLKKNYICINNKKRYMVRFNIFKKKLKKNSFVDILTCILDLIVSL